MGFYESRYQVPVQPMSVTNAKKFYAKRKLCFCYGNILVDFCLFTCGSSLSPTYVLYFVTFS